ncbi:hypothetical protein FNH22_00475 [Fulvivirga sp. M361]|uniref:hypothetical protein n=1 Tax=Fulvivirga sp. M361 TaxID=2594266 RepID=UPI00117A29F0|nr:hypothetical protein [Fulvivirga sp. M361]TRX62605.1 hypothetical protein FNH22_00475 [Fulvivirga sp. M361]
MLWICSFLMTMVTSAHIYAYDAARIDPNSMGMTHNEIHPSIRSKKPGFVALDEEEFVASTLLPQHEIGSVPLAKKEKDFTLYYIGMFTGLFLTSIVKLFALLIEVLVKRKANIFFTSHSSLR